MYFITAVALTLVAALLWFIFRKKKILHFNYLTMIFGAASLMWLIDVIFSAAKGEEPFGFEALDWWISLWTLLAGFALWGIIVLILYRLEKKEVTSN